jgi:hypothetical protein
MRPCLSLAPPSHRILRCADERGHVSLEREQTERHLEAQGEKWRERERNCPAVTAGPDRVCRSTEETAGDTLAGVNAVDDSSCPVRCTTPRFP